MFFNSHYPNLFSFWHSGIFLAHLSRVCISPGPLKLNNSEWNGCHLFKSEFLKQNILFYCSKKNYPKLIKEHSHVPNLQQGPPSYLRKHSPSTKTDILSQIENTISKLPSSSARLYLPPRYGDVRSFYIPNPPQIFLADSPVVLLCHSSQPDPPQFRLSGGNKR